MCTALLMNKGKNAVFGRNMDMEYEWGQQPVATPRNFTWPMRFTKPLKQKYAMIGMAMPFKDPENGGHDYPLYSEAANEKGLACAGLNFPKNAFYPEPGKTKATKGKLVEITPFEVVQWVLANFETTAQVKDFFAKNTIAIVNKPICQGLDVATLHFIVSDKSGESFVFEPTKDGIKTYDNPLGIMTNNPTFDWQLTNLARYQNLGNTQKFPEVDFLQTARGQGFAMMGLPGDTTPPSRFVRTAFYKFNSAPDNTIESLVNEFFHILGSVEMVKGSIIVGKNKKGEKLYDITLFSSCIDLNKMVYYYRTYWNSQICAVDMYAINGKDNNKWLDGKDIAIFPFERKQGINYLNK